MKKKNDAPAPAACGIAIDPTQITRVKGEKFVVDILVDHTPWRLMLPAASRASLMASLTFLAAVHHPRVEGWNIYGAEGPDEGKLLESVSAVDFVGQVTAMTPLKLNPSGSSSKGVIPVVSPTSEAFQKMLEEAKKEGKIPK